MIGYRSGDGLTVPAGALLPAHAATEQATRTGAQMMRAATYIAPGTSEALMSASTFHSPFTFLYTVT
jgi:hypothetical protein